MAFLLHNARLILSPSEGIVSGWLLMENGRIAGIGPTGDEPASELSSVDCGGDFLAPGLVDIHCHGALGHDVMEASPEAFGTILGYHASRGSTSLVLTTVAASLPDMRAVLECASRYRQTSDHSRESRLEGIHLEGPHFSPCRRGAHRGKELRSPSRAETDSIIRYADVIRRVTLAPELPGCLDLVRELCLLGISVSAGHSDATENEALAGFAAGISQVTHLHNAMSSIRKTSPPRRGLAEASLETPGICCELIADGVHVPAELLREAWLAKGWEGIVLVSDATAGAGLADGALFRLGELSCRVEGNVAWTTDGEGHGRCLAGSTSCLIDGVRTMVETIGVPLVDAVAMATMVPARLIGREGEVGSLKPGKSADLVRFSKEWQVRGVWISGN